MSRLNSKVPKEQQKISAPFAVLPAKQPASVYTAGLTFAKDWSVNGPLSPGHYDPSCVKVSVSSIHLDSKATVLHCVFLSLFVLMLAALCCFCHLPFAKHFYWV